MISPHTHVALLSARDDAEARKAARRPDAVPDPAPQRAVVAARGRVRRSLIRLRLTSARQA